MMNELRRLSTAIHTSNTPEVVLSSIHVILLLLRVVGAQAMEVGVSTSIYNINLVAYGYSGEGVGTTALLRDGFSSDGKMRDSDGGYVQATYVIPTGTKLGVSYGVSKLDDNAADAGKGLVEENTMLTIGAYHPLTKHLNLVAEYSNVEAEAHDTVSDAESNIFSVGAILFF
jgi:predicted porin